MTPSSLAARATLVLLALAAASGASAQSVENVLLVVNENSAASREIGEYYAAKRGLPPSQVVRLTAENAERISRTAFEQTIEAPIARWLERASAQDRILYIVLTKGIPLRIDGAGTGRTATEASVDSELALLYRRLVGIAVPPAGPVPNPYFLGSAAVAEARPFSHERHDIYLVTRLDGFAVEDVKALIDRSATPAGGGPIVLDGRLGPATAGDRWLASAAARVEAQGAAGVSATLAAEIPAGIAGALGYFSWGSNDPRASARHPGVTFAPGALAAMFVGGDARTFAEPPAEWVPGQWGAPATYFAGAPASLTGDLVRHGVTGVAGSVGDPFLEGSIRPDILFPAYVAGRNLAEAFYLALPFVSWQTVVVGDPLTAPFTGSRASSAELDPPRAAVSELPSYFSERRVATMAKTGIKPEAIELYLRADSRFRNDDPAGGREALERATAVDERLIPAHALLASIHTTAGEHEKAVERYRRVLAYAPNDPIALNNLAYALAVHLQRPSEALAYAEKAYSIANTSAAIADTIGWIHHLLGDHAAATRLLATAIERDPDAAEIHLHAAIAFAAADRGAEAQAALTRALVLDPSLESRGEIATLRAALPPQP
jgi:uncharacterized protein (TIGR03790 family)